MREARQVTLVHRGLSPGRVRADSRFALTGVGTWALLSSALATVGPTAEHVVTLL